MESVCFKGHKRFFIRKEWLIKGLQEVKQNPRVFFENFGADALGVSIDMAKSIRYWLKCSGMTDESVRTVVRLTDLGEIILKKDPYFEKLFSLWVIHCNIARNKEQATVCQLFFNEFCLEKFTREELEEQMLELAGKVAGTQKISTRSVKDDCDLVLRMYTELHGTGNRKGKDSSPFARMGLLIEADGIYIKKQPELQNLPIEVILFLLPGIMPKGRGISIEELLTTENGPGRILNLEPFVLTVLLEQLGYSGKLMVHKTEGIDMVYLPEWVKQEHVLQDYYR